MGVRLPLSFDVKFPPSTDPFHLLLVSTFCKLNPPEKTAQ
jgi:hypothetical protein